MPKHHTRKPHRNSGKIKLIVLTVAVIIILALTVTATYVMNYKPTIDVVDNPFGTTASTVVTTPPPITGDDPSSETTKKPEAKPYTVRKEEFFNILVVGKDRVGQNTDVIMIASYDVKNGNVSIMQIPRDTYFEIDGTPHKINSVYSLFFSRAYRDGSKNPANDGMASFASAIQQNMNIAIDFYVLINLDTFREIVDILDGVEVYVPADLDYDDPDQDLYIHLKKGLQTLSGKDAENFIRFRNGYITADIGRIDAQKIFMSAFAKQFKEKLSIANIQPLAEQILKNVTTNLSLLDCVYFGQNMLSVDLSNLNMITLPGTDARSNVTSGLWYYILHRDDTLALINAHFNVFTDDITPEIFDHAEAFNDGSKEHFNKIYFTPLSEDFDELSKTADSIIDNSIDIPMIH